MKHNQKDEKGQSTTSGNQNTGKTNMNKNENSSSKSSTDDGEEERATPKSKGSDLPNKAGTQNTKIAGSTSKSSDSDEEDTDDDRNENEGAKSSGKSKTPATHHAGGQDKMKNHK